MGFLELAKLLLDTKRRCGNTDQVAHNDLAVASGEGTLGRSGLRAGIAGRLCVLLDTTCWGSGGRSGTTLRVAATTSGAALSGGNLVKRLVELARHDDWF